MYLSHRSLAMSPIQPPASRLLLLRGNQSEEAGASASTVTSAAVCPPRCQSTATLTVPLPRTITSTRPSCGLVALPLDLTGAVGEYPPERPAR